MKDLKERILKLRGEISELKRESKAIQSKIDHKKEVLTDLEKLTVNQITMFEDSDNNAYSNHQ